MKWREIPQYKALSWYLDFFSLNLNTLSEREISKLAIDAKHFIERAAWPLFGPDASGWSNDQKGFSSMKDLPDKWWKEKIGGEKDQTNLERVKEELECFLRLHFLEGTPGSRIPIAEPYLQFGIQGGRGAVTVRYNSPPGHYADRDEVIKRGKINLAMALDGVPLDAVKSCPECGRFFLHLSKRPRYFCGPTCSSVAISRRRREKDPEKYREYQRKVMQDKYRIEKGLKTKKFYKNKPAKYQRGKDKKRGIP